SGEVDGQEADAELGVARGVVHLGGEEQGCDGGRLEGELDGVAVDDAVADVVVLEAGLGDGVEGAEVYLGPGAGVTDDGADDVRLDRAAAAARVAGGEEDERCGEQQDGAQDVLQVLGFPFCLVASRAYLAWT